MVSVGLQTEEESLMKKSDEQKLREVILAAIGDESWHGGPSYDGTHQERARRVVDWVVKKMKEI